MNIHASSRYSLHVYTSQIKLLTHSQHIQNHMKKISKIDVFKLNRIFEIEAHVIFMYDLNLCKAKFCKDALSK